jgi:hypothetical protein
VRRRRRRDDDDRDDRDDRDHGRHHHRHDHGVRTMKLKALLLALLVAGLGSSFALADDGHGEKGSSTGTGTNATTTRSEEPKGDKGGDCRKLELKGTLASVAGATFTINVTKANEGGSALQGKPATLTVDAKTRVKWEGTGSLTGPNAGDRLSVVATQCKATPTLLTAVKVDARGGADAKPEHK